MIRSRVLLLMFVAGCCPAAPATNAAAPKPPAPSPAPTREAGLAAFETVRGVFQHPRCQNCHPSGDAPLQGDDGQVHNQNVLRGPSGAGVVGLECTSCHGAANVPASYGGHIPLRRLGTPEEIAEVLLFLSSERSRGVNGETVYASGGMVEISL